MLKILLITTLGILTGIITGLMPGIHPNTVLFGSLPLKFGLKVENTIFIPFVIGLSVAHTFFEFIPAVFLAVPEPESALAALPGSELVKRGEGLKAVDATVVGGLISTVFLSIAAPLIFHLLKPIYSTLSALMFFILVFFISVIVFNSEKIVRSVFIAFTAGLTGLIGFNSYINQKYVLMPIFIGMFALPALLKTDYAEFSISNGSREIKFRPFSSGIGLLMGVVSGIVPGIGSATATSFLAPYLDDQESFLTAIGSLNTVNILVSFLAIYLIDKARSGAAVALKSLFEVGFRQVVVFSGLSIFSAGVSAAFMFILTPYLASGLGRLVGRRFKRFLSASLIFVVFALTGPRGVLLCLSCGFLGYAAAISGTRKSLMAVLIVPAILFYSNGIFM